MILSVAVGDPRRQAPGRGRRAKVEPRTDSSEESFRVVEAGYKVWLTDRSVNGHPRADFMVKT